MIDEKVCTERMKTINEKIEINIRRLNDHGGRLKVLETSKVKLEKDHSQLLDLLERLEQAVENLTKVVETLKERPAQRYEQIVMYVILAVIAFFLGQVL